MHRHIQISIVIPVYNEEKNVQPLYRQLSSVLRKHRIKAEIIFVDDGSTDRTYNELSKLPNIKIIRLNRNFGQTTALKSGFEESSGEVVVTLDGDMQNDPRDIPKLLNKLNQGYDLVNGWRQTRQDNLSKTVPSKIANWIISKISGADIKDNGCSLRVFKKNLIEDIDLHGEMHRFIPTLAFWKGAKIIEMKVNHLARRDGVSKYGIKRLPFVLLDLITIKFLFNYLDRPMRIFGLTGIISISTGLLISIILGWERVVNNVPLSGRPLLFLGTLLIILGFQFVYFGLLAEIAIRIYFNKGGVKNHIIKEIIQNK